MKFDASLVAEIKQYIYENRLTQEEFAAKLGVSAPTVSRWLAGRYRSIGDDVGERLKTLLGAPPSGPSARQTRMPQVAEMARVYGMSLPKTRPPQPKVWTGGE